MRQGEGSVGVGYILAGEPVTPVMNLDITRVYLAPVSLSTGIAYKG